MKKVDCYLFMSTVGEFEIIKHNKNNQIKKIL